jgi:DNA-directed RNA polymerase subunit F
MKSGPGLTRLQKSRLGSLAWWVKQAIGRVKYFQGEGALDAETAQRLREELSKIQEQLQDRIVSERS